VVAPSTPSSSPHVHHCKIRVTEDAFPGQRVAWLVLENYFTHLEYLRVRAASWDARNRGDGDAVAGANLRVQDMIPSMEEVVLDEPRYHSCRSLLVPARSGHRPFAAPNGFRRACAVGGHADLVYTVKHVRPDPPKSEVLGRATMDVVQLVAILGAQVLSKFGLDVQLLRDVDAWWRSIKGTDARRAGGDSSLQVARLGGGRSYAPSAE